MKRKQLLPLLCMGLLSLTACSNRDQYHDTSSNARDTITGLQEPDLRNYREGFPHTGTMDGIGAMDGMDGVGEMDGIGGMNGMEGFGTVGGAMEGLSQGDSDYLLSPLAYPQEDSQDCGEVASWELMIDHGQYHATAQGKVYPYGEAGFYGKEFHERGLWEHAKDTMEDSIHEAERGVEDLSKDMEHGLDTIMGDGKAKAEK